MFTEVWERLRGYDKWVAAVASVESSEVNRTSHTNASGRVVGYTYDSGDVLVWADAHGERHEAYFKVPDESSLYQMISGEKIAIRYNPANPDEFFLRELLQTRVHRVVTWTVAILLFVGVVILGVWFRLSMHR